MPDLPAHNSEHLSSPDLPKSSPSGGKLIKERSGSQQALQRARGSTRNASKSGGMNVVLGETGSWSDLADKSTTIPAEGVRGVKGGKPSGMLGFLSRKSGRARSPKPREPGVLGKEGARVVINSGGR